MKRERNYRHKVLESALEAERDVLLLYAEGIKPCRIATMLHIGEWNVYYYLNKADIILPRSKRYVENMRKEIKEYHEKHMNTSEIARKLNKNPTTVLYHLKAMGLGTNKPPKKEKILKKKFKSYKDYLRESSHPINLSKYKKIQQWGGTI